MYGSGVPVTAMVAAGSEKVSHKPAPEDHDLPQVGPDGMRDLTCGACGGVFGTNFHEEQIECAHCDARRCPHCGEWFGRDD